MRKLTNLIFVAIGAAILSVLIMAPKETTRRTPGDAIHANPKEYSTCTNCHMPGGEAPTVKADHLSEGGKLRVDFVKCYMCHKPERR